MSGEVSLHPSVVEILRFFRWHQLPPELRAVSQPFAALAVEVALRSQRAGVSGPETTTALRKLLEAKDAAVRAVLPVHAGGTLLEDLLEDPRHTPNR